MGEFWMREGEDTSVKKFRVVITHDLEYKGYVVDVPELRAV